MPLQVQEELEAMSEEIQNLNEQVAHRDEDLLNLNQELSELTDRLPVRSLCPWPCLSSANPRGAHLLVRTQSIGAAEVR